MVSFSRAFCRVSAAIAATLSDPTTTQPEVPKPCEGSLGFDVDPVLNLDPIGEEIVTSEPSPVCVLEKKHHRFRKFRPCKRLVAKARKLKAKVKNHFHAFAAKKPANSGKCRAPSNCPDSQMTREALNSMIALHNYQAENFFSTWDDSLICDLFLAVTDSDSEPDLACREIFSPEPSQAESSATTSSPTTSSNEAKPTTVTQTRNQFTPIFFKKMWALFQMVQKYQHVSPVFTMKTTLKSMATLPLTPCFQPFYVLLPRIFPTKCLVPAADLKEPQFSPPLASFIDYVLSNLQPLQLRSPLTVPITSLTPNVSFPTEIPVQLTKATGSIDFGPHFGTPDVCVDRSLDQCALEDQDSQASDSSSEFIEDVVSDEWCVPFERAKRFEFVELKNVEEFDFVVAAKKSYPHFVEFRLLIIDYMPLPSAVNVSGVSATSLKFSTTNKVVEYNKDGAPVEVLQNAVALENRPLKGCLKKSNFKKSPQWFDQPLTFEFDEAWHKQLTAKFFAASNVGTCYEEPQYEMKIQEYLHVSQVTFSKLTVAVYDVKAHGLRGFVTEACATIKLLEEVVNGLNGVANRLHVLFDQYVDANKMGSLTTVRRAFRKEMVLHSALSTKLESARAKISAIEGDIEGALEQYNNESQNSVATVTQILKEFDRVMTEHLVPNYPGTLKKELLQMCGRTDYDVWCKGYESNYLKDAKLAVSLTVDDLQERVEALDDFVLSLKDALSGLYQDVSSVISHSHR